MGNVLSYVSVLRFSKSLPTWARDDVAENTREMTGLNVDSAANEVVVAGDPIPCVAADNEGY
jgi:hypothetical protein